MKRYVKASDARLAELTSDIDKLVQLAESPSASVRFRVALNKNTPIDILVNLLHDPDPHVRYGAAFNENIPESEMQAIADAPTTTRNYKLKLSLIDNINCPVYILEQLASDRDPDVASQAKHRLDSESSQSAWERDNEGILRFRGYR